MKRKVLMAAMLLGSAIMLFAGGATEKADAGGDGKVRLTVWAEFASPEKTEFLNKAVAQYEQEHPNVDLVLTSLPDKADQKIMTAYEAGQGPDVFISSGPDVSSHINGGYILKLNDYFDRWADKDKILPGAIETVRQYDITGKDDIYYIPNGIAFSVLWAREDWLKEKGASVDTWNHFFDAVEKLTDKSQQRYGLTIRGGKGGAKFLERLLYSYSGLQSLFDENGKCTINDPKHVEFVERYLGAYGKYTGEGDINAGNNECIAAFDSGHAGLYFHNLGSAGDHMKAFNNDQTKFKAYGMPYNEKGTSVNLMLQPGGATISSTCKNPDAAWDFVAWFSTGERVSEYARLYGVIPVESTVLKDAEWIKSLPWCEAAAEALLDPNTQYYNQYAWLPGRNAIFNEMDTESQYVMSGEMTAKEMLDNWAADRQKAYDEYYKK